MSRCLFCGAPAAERHHPTAQLTGSSSYLDASFTVPVCIRCHHAEHAVWRQIGLDEIESPLLARLCRTTWLVGRLADLECPAPPDVVRGLHGCLVAVLVEVQS